MDIHEISAEVRANFDAWFEHNFVSENHGRIGVRTYTRAGELDDALAGTTRESRFVWYSDAYVRGLLDRSEVLKFDEFAFLARNPLIALQLALGITDLRGLRCYRRGLSHEVNRLQQRSYRARYYARDNARRRRLAAERRRITRRTTTNPCPTPAEFLAAFERRNESVEARIRFGGMVHDLECYVDNCLKYDEYGEICGRNGGIRAWIANNLPQLNGKYKTIMRYKALAKRLRQAAEIPDPVPTAAVYDGVPAAVGGAGRGIGNYYAVNSHRQALGARLDDSRRLLGACGNAFEEVRRAVDAWLDAAAGRDAGGGGAVHRDGRRDHEVRRARV